MNFDRLAILADLHASASMADGETNETQDGSYVRILSNWSQRLTEFITAALLYKADRLVLLGDIVHATDSDQVTVLAAVCTQIATEIVGSSIIVHVLPGNHDCSHLGTVMLLHEFQGAVEGNIGAGNRPTIPAASKWPGNPTQIKYVSYISNGTNFRYVHCWGSAGGSTLAKKGWNTDDPANYAYEDTVDEIIRPLGDPKNQMDWVDDQSFNNNSKPYIVFCHEPLGHIDGSPKIHADIQAVVQGDLAAEVVAGYPVSVFDGHYHRVFPIGDGHTWRKDTINNVDYYTLRGSVLGKNAYDMQGNTFYIVDVDTVLGVTDAKIFEYNKDIRGRYVNYDISQERLRSRYV